MKTTLKFQFVRLVLLALPVLVLNPVSLKAQSGNPEISAEMLEKIDLVNNRLTDAIQKGDLNKMMDLYADDAMLMLPGGKSLKGKKEISQYFAGQKNIRTIKMNVTDAGGGGKIIYQVGKATYTTTIDGKETEQTQDFVMVLKRQSDWDYKIAVTSSN